MSQHFENYQTKSVNGKQIFSLKFTHFISSLLIVGSGIFILIAFISIWESTSGYEIFVNHYTNVPGIVCLVGALIIIAVGWLGVIVAYQEVYRGICTFYVLVCLLLISTIIGWIYFYFSMNSFENLTLDTLIDAKNNYHSNKENIDNLQIKLYCCGVYNHDDWTKLLGHIPGSCCNSTEPCDYIYTLHEIHKNGCFFVLHKLIQWNIIYSFITTIFLDGFFVLSMILSYLLCRELNNQKQKKILDNQSEIRHTVTNNPLAQASAPLQDSSSSDFEIQQNYLHYNEQHKIYNNFWTPRVYNQEFTSNRLELPNYALMLKELDKRRQKEKPSY